MTNLFQPFKDRVALDAGDELRQFIEFYIDLYLELGKCGTIEELLVSENLADHLVGNVFARFSTPDEARHALLAIGGRTYDGRPIVAEFSNVIDFHEATCRLHEMSACARGG